MRNLVLRISEANGPIFDPRAVQRSDRGAARGSNILILIKKRKRKRKRKLLQGEPESKKNEENQKNQASKLHDVRRLVAEVREG